MNIIEKLGITPGPWEEVECFSGVNCWCSTISSTSVINKDGDNELVISSGSMNKKNAPIISAAPEMLMILIKDIIKSEKNWIDNNSFSFSPSNKKILKECHKFNKNKITVIQKATGKSWEEIKDMI